MPGLKHGFAVIATDRSPFSASLRNNTNVSGYRYQFQVTWHLNILTDFQHLADKGLYSQKESEICSSACEH
jgi:hypothetical protein